MTGDWNGCQVVGHVNPVGAYPAYVVPVVSKDGETYSVYLSDRRSLDLRPAPDYVKGKVRSLGADNACFREADLPRLFAFSEEDVVLYREAEATDFWRKAVNETGLMDSYPFVALDLAIDTRKRPYIIVTLAACASKLTVSEAGQAYIADWYAGQCREVLREFRGEMALPERWEDLQIETLLLPEAEFPEVERSLERVEDSFARRDVEARAGRLARRKSRRLIDALLEWTAATCARRKRTPEWAAFFGYYLEHQHPVVIAERLGLASTEAVIGQANLAMATFLDVVEQAKSRVPALAGLARSALPHVLASTRALALPLTIDIVFCIDETGSMKPFIDSARGIVSDFHNRLSHAMNQRGLTVGQVHARVISFRDFFCDDFPAIKMHGPFMPLPQEESYLNHLLGTLHPDGGGDDPESSLEATAMALESHWVSSGPHSVHIIMVFTDAPAHPLEKASTPPPHYPDNMPHSLADMRARWERFCAKSTAAVQRLVLFAPSDYPWPDMANWDNVLHIVSRGGDGLRTIPEDAIVESIAQGLS